MLIHIREHGSHHSKHQSTWTLICSNFIKLGFTLKWCRMLCKCDSGDDGGQDEKDMKDNCFMRTWDNLVGKKQKEFSRDRRDQHGNQRISFSHLIFWCKHNILFERILVIFVKAQPYTSYKTSSW